MSKSFNPHYNYIEQAYLLSLIKQHHDNQELYLGYKSEQLKIQTCNESLAHACGYKNADQLYGIRDEEISCRSAKLAPDYIMQDTKVLSGYKLMILDLVPLKDENYLSFTTRIPMTGEKFNIIGSAFFGYRIKNNPLLNSLSHLIIPPKNKSAGLSLILNESHVLLTENQHQNNLSKKEFEILWLLCRGLCPKKIAAYFYRSPRTIEEHIDHIKIKYHCEHKSELIAKAIANGILSYLPFDIAINKKSSALFS